MWCSGRCSYGVLVARFVHVGRLLPGSAAGNPVARDEIRVTACSGPGSLSLARLSGRERPDVYARRGRVVACPVRCSAEEHHPCPTFIPRTTESSLLAAVSGASTT